ncbi:MAG: hypothetical protein ACKOC5_10150 [Chloroflexota bacterium]
MTTNAQLFLDQLQAPAFRDAFESADASGRQKLLDQAGLLIPLKEAEAIFADLTGEISEADLQQAAGGGYGITLPPPEGDD